MRWIDRNLIHTPLCYALCVSEKEFQDELQRLKIKQHVDFVNRGANATTHTFLPGKNYDAFCIVCVKQSKKHTLIEYIGLIVHEAMHVWRDMREEIGEDSPSAEFEAYSMQMISQQLITDFLNTRIGRAKLRESINHK